MRSISLFCLSATGVFLAAGLLYAAQNRRFENLRNASLSAPEANTPHSSPGAGASQGFSSPPKPRPAVTGRLIERSDIKVRASMDPQDYADLIEYLDETEWRTMYLLTDMTKEEGDRIWEHMAETRLEKARNRLNSGVSSAERIAAETALEKAQEKWLEEQLGAERFAKYRASLGVQRRSGRERDAAQGLARIDRVVTLRPEQKDALHAGLLEAAARMEAEKPDPLLGFRPFGKITEGPSAPDIDAEAQALLSAAQWDTYQGIRTIQDEGETSMRGYIKKMLPPILGAFQELMDESAGAAPASTSAPVSNPASVPPTNPKSSADTDSADGKQGPP